MNTGIESGKDEHTRTDAVVIEVNLKPVRLPEHKVTGLQIKEAAIDQGLPIELGFALFRMTGSEQHRVRDRDEITVHAGEKFRCIKADDNS